MSIKGRIDVTCPGCGRPSEVELFQSINTRHQPELKARLLAADLNVLACACGRRSQLVATLLYHDPEAGFYCQVVPGGDADMEEAAETFAAVGASGTLRLVPSQNALVEKVKILDAKLEDWAVEMAKILSLASSPERDLDRVMLFGKDEGDALVWVLYVNDEQTFARSSRAAYDRLAERTASAPGPDELRIDRAWALAAVQKMIAAGN